ncbi:MAG: hypothetical protein JW941_00195 [Candidatus Coatesbacteria bacterium]|nr:hypothetical protein [Candidatus Coatesbacteria bacterium]
MREFDLSDFNDEETQEGEEEEQPEITGGDEFEPVIIEAARLNPDGAMQDATFSALAAEEIKQQFARRDAHIKIYTSHFKIVGKLLVPAEGAMTRLTDTLNMPDKHFLPITDAEVTSLMTGKVIQSNTFVAINREDVQIIIPITEPAKPTAKIDFTGDTFSEDD